MIFIVESTAIIDFFCVTRTAGNLGLLHLFGVALLDLRFLFFTGVMVANATMSSSTTMALHARLGGAHDVISVQEMIENVFKLP